MNPSALLSPLVGACQETGTSANASASSTSGMHVTPTKGVSDFPGPAHEPVTRFWEKKDMAGFAEYVIADPATSVPLPEGIEFEQAAPLTCAGATAWTGLAYAGIPPWLTYRHNRHRRTRHGLDLAASIPSHFRPRAILDSTARDDQNQIVHATEWCLKLLCTHGTWVPLGLPTEGFKVSAFDVVFKGLTIRGSLVANRCLVAHMMRFVVERGVRGHR
ncbi:hypothetical protein N8T08_003619 [Aspergillus melleus]|uniref:Uncharacterized protein n=1 Tax=Aspergillus melleus TaxID=138277 RepID=A0ACC3B6B5_9EURO|nr:hypothetical protein N8T08_003619 [Aspergillus melleus]